MDIKEVLLGWFINFLIKKHLVEESKMKLCLKKELVLVIAWFRVQLTINLARDN